MEWRRIIKAGFARLDSNEMEMSRKLYNYDLSSAQSPQRYYALETVAAQQQPLMKILEKSHNHRSAKLHIYDMEMSQLKLIAYQ